MDIRQGMRPPTSKELKPIRMERIVAMAAERGVTGSADPPMLGVGSVISLTPIIRDSCWLIT